MKGDEVGELPEVDGASEGCSKCRLVPAMLLSKCLIGWEGCLLPIRSQLLWCELSLWRGMEVSSEGNMNLLQNILKEKNSIVEREFARYLK